MIVNTRGARVGSRRVGRRLLVCVSAVLLLAACNGDDDAVSSSAPPVTPVTIAPTTVATTSDPPTTTVARTDPPTTTASSTIAVTATATPSPSTVAATPTSAEGSDEQSALALIADAYRVWIECLASVPTCDTSTFDRYVTDPQLRGDKETIAEYQANGYQVDGADSLVYDVLEVNLAASIPHVVVCERDQSTVVQRLPGEPERIIEENDVASVREIHLARAPGGWKVEGFATREDESCV